MLKRLSIIWCKHEERPKGFYEDLFRVTRAIVNCVGSGVSRPGNLPFHIVKDLVEEIVTVSEKEMETALRYLVSRGKIVTELAGTAAVAALLAEKIAPRDSPTVCLITGGNIDIQVLSSLLGEKD